MPRELTGDKLLIDQLRTTVRQLRAADKPRAFSTFAAWFSEHPEAMPQLGRAMEDWHVTYDNETAAMCREEIANGHIG